MGIINISGRYIVQCMVGHIVLRKGLDRRLLVEKERLNVRHF